MNTAIIYNQSALLHSQFRNDLTRQIIIKTTPRPYTSTPRSRSLPIIHASNRDSRRLIPLVLSAPRRVEEYFDRYPLRRVMWCALSVGAGFYAGNIVTLSFGALAINDILAAVVTLIFYEIVTQSFYSTPNPTLRQWFANCFKIGVVAAMMTDAIKLGG